VRAGIDRYQDDVGHSREIERLLNVVCGFVSDIIGWTHHLSMRSLPTQLQICLRESLVVGKMHRSFLLELAAIFRLDWIQYEASERQATLVHGDVVRLYIQRHVMLDTMFTALSRSEHYTRT